MEPVKQEMMFLISEDNLTVFRNNGNGADVIF
jgi:hypothetical protein